MATKSLHDKVENGGRLPKFINKYGQKVGAEDRDKLNLVTFEIHGHKATAQAVVMRHYLALVDNLKERGIVIAPISSFRTYQEQVNIIQNICGGSPSAGCPGLAAPAGYSAHETGAAFDSHLISRGGNSYEDTYRIYIHEAGKENFYNFSHSSDPWHLSFAEPH